MDAQELLQQAKLNFAPPERIKVSEWVAKYYELPETSAEPGKWNPKRAPYQVGIMDAICEPGIKQVSIMCSAQVGKTITLLAIICYLIDLDPCSILLTFPAANDAEIFSKEKLSSAIRHVKPVSNKIIDKSRDASSTILMKMFPGGFLRLTGANSPGSLASMAIRVYLGDEIDKYPASAGKEGDPIKLAKKRTSTFWNWMMLLTSTPGLLKTSRINEEYEKSDKRRYFVPCPHCGHKQHLTWERIEYAGKDTDDADPLSGVYYICEKCDRPIEEKYKAKMVRQGEWQATAVADDPRHAGFHINRLSSPWKRWVDLALDYEAAKHDPQQLKVFWNSTLGLPFENTNGEKLDWEELRDRSKTSGYAQSEIPDGVLMLTAGVDVQGDRLEVAVLGWGRDEQCYVIRYEQIMGDPLKDDVWQQLANVTGKSYYTRNDIQIKVRATCIDTGYLTQDVYKQIKQHRYLHWFAIKGRSGDRPLVSKPSKQKLSYKGKKTRASIDLYIVGVDTAKETAYARSQITKPGPKYLNFANDLPNEWFQGFCSEVQVTQHKNGRPYLVWEKLPGVRNEPLDLFNYAYAAADLAGLSRMNWGKLEQKYHSKA